MRTIIAAIAVASTLSAPALAMDFRLYPGFLKKHSFVQMTNDRGLTVEIMLRCERKGKKPVAGFMIYSKLDGVYCSSKHLCTKDASQAANDTCGY